MSSNHTIRAYEKVASHHARGACEVSRFTTGSKFGFHHIDGAKLDDTRRILHAELVNDSDTIFQYVSTSDT